MLCYCPIGCIPFIAVLLSMDCTWVDLICSGFFSIVFSCRWLMVDASPVGTAPGCNHVARCYLVSTIFGIVL